MRRMIFPLALFLLALLCIVAPTHAAVLPNALMNLAPGEYSSILKAFVLLTALSLLPFFFIALTSFTRIIVVLSLVRSALGLQQTPPNAVLITLAMFLTFFSMAPVLQAIQKDAVTPYINQKINIVAAVQQGFKPIKAFMVRQTHQADLESVLKMAKAPRPKTIQDIHAVDLIPAFMLSELQTAFQIGFVIYLPFLLIDIVVAAILMSLGMIMVPPATLSLPLKILLFLMINGWTLIAEALLSGYTH